MSAQEVAVVVVFAAWGLLSLVAQWKSASIKALRRRDVLRLIPNWRFFAPAPARQDYHLEFRVRDRGRPEPEPWTRVPLSSRRDWRCVALNPRKRTRKAFNTAVRRIVQLLRDHGYDAAARSLSYLKLLYFVQSRYAGPSAVELQFRIVSCQDLARDCRDRLVFTSSWHVQETPSHASRPA